MIRIGFVAWHKIAAKAEDRAVDGVADNY